MLHDLHGTVTPEGDVAERGHSSEDSQSTLANPCTAALDVAEASRGAEIKDERARWSYEYPLAMEGSGRIVDFCTGSACTQHSEYVYLIIRHLAMSVRSEPEWVGSMGFGYDKVQVLEKMPRDVPG